MPAPKRILVIDDADDVRILVERQLVRLGYAAEGAVDGVDGLEAIARHKPDLVLCDLRMPRLDGLGVLSELRDKYPQLPVVVMSGEGLLEDAVSALRLGAWDYLSKPIAGMAVLQHAVGKALEKAELLAENQRQRDKLEVLYRELADDQDAGRRLQLSLLPENGMKVGSFTLTRELLPSSFLSGDFCSTFSLPDGRWGFYLADVAGHGVPSALVTVMLRTVVERWVLEGRDASFFAPSTFLKALNQELIRQRHEKHVALFYGLVDESRSVLACGNAGCFPWPVLLQGGNTFTMELPGMPLGLMDTATYDERTYELLPDTKFVACTDGVFDVMEGGGVDETSRRIAEAADKSATATELVQVLGLTAHRARPDDVAVLMLKRGGANALRPS
ncbi:MAG: PP2C family protein-serine/threonine phosphatase [Archangium sp.]